MSPMPPTGGKPIPFVDDPPCGFISRSLGVVLLLLIVVLSASAQDEGEDFGMTGCMISSQGDYRSVIQVLKHSPAADAGIEVGDAILAIDDKGTNGLELAEFLKRMRGKPGTEVVLTVRSHDNGVVFNYTLKRMSVRAYREAN